MKIKALGHASFRLSKKGIAIITDPFDPKIVGLPFPKISADVVTVSHQHADHNCIDRIKGEPLVISGPGSYEIKGVRITGIASYHDNKRGKERGKNTIYNIMIDGINIVHLGDLGHRLEDNQIDELPDVDILMIPTGGYYTISSKVASDIVAQLEPKIVIPMHYRVKGLVEKLANRLEPVDEFLKNLGEEKVAASSTLVIKKSELPEETQVMLLEPDTKV